MFTKARIRKHEVGLWFRHGDFKAVLEPGVYRHLGRMVGRDRIEVFVGEAVAGDEPPRPR